MPATEVTNTEESSTDELRAALNKAADDNELAGDDEVKPEPKSGKKEAANDPDEDEDDDKKGSDDESEDDEEDDEEVEQANQEQQRALAFYRSITNPETAEQVLNSIAKKAGYELKSLNKEQRDAVTSGIEEVLREELGDEFAILPQGLSKALTRIVNGLVKPTQDEINSLKAKIAAGEEGMRKVAVDEALAWAAVEYPEFKAESKRILKEMKAFPPAPNMNTREYIKKICKLVDIEPKQSVDNSRSNRNKNNKEGNTPSDGVRKERSTKVASSLAEAAAMAFEEQFPD